VFVDVDPVTFCMNPKAVEAAITERTKAVIPVHLFGHPADLAPISELARRYNLWLIEDAALATGAEYKGRKVGGIGDMGCFSFGPAKVLGAFGDAGIVVTNSAELARRIRVLRNYGHESEEESARSCFQRHRWNLVAEGFNERLDELQAAVLRVKLSFLEERIEKRRKIASIYNELLCDCKLVTPVETGDVKHVYRAYTILVDQRDSLQGCLAAHGVESIVYYVPPLHLQPAYRHLGHKVGDFPVAEKIASEMLSLPIYPDMTEHQVKYVAEVVRTCVSRLGK